ncbi:MAG: oxidoreductase, partial [Verrucomicrobiae bacterium]|nr:oxidoreductase [Verrucomicrobiae bacterium]
MQTLTSFAAPLVALFPIAAGLWCRRLSAGAAGRLATRAAGASLAVLAALATAALFTGGGLDGGWFALDGPALVMAVLVSFVGTMVLRFSRNHLAGDPAQSRFFSWMCLTLGAVLLMVTSGHLAMLFAAWVTTSLCLHRLLLHRPERAGAVFSARKKYVFSRIGDACLLGALVILFRGHGTLWIDDLTASIAAGNTAGLTSAAFLIAFAAALKSAQFPFHSWLPDTMETPTPVSAFMHAGIINAGGFLVIRMAPVF